MNTIILVITGLAVLAYTGAVAWACVLIVMGDDIDWGEDR